MVKSFKIAILLILIIFTFASCKMDTKGYHDITGNILISKGSSSAVPDLSVIYMYYVTLETDGSPTKWASVDFDNLTYSFRNVTIEDNLIYTLRVRALRLYNNGPQKVAETVKVFKGSDLKTLENLNNLNIFLNFLDDEGMRGVFKFKVSIPIDTEVNKIKVSNADNQTWFNFTISTYTYTEDGKYKVFERETSPSSGNYNFNVQYFNNNVEVHKYSNIYVHIEPRLISTFDRTELSNFNNIIITPTFTEGRDGSSDNPFYIGDKITLTATEGALISVDDTEGTNSLTITLNEVGDDVLIEAVASKEYYCDAVFSQTYKVIAN